MLKLGISAGRGAFNGDLNDMSGVSFVFGLQGLAGVSLVVPANYKGPLNLNEILKAPGAGLIFSAGVKAGVIADVSMTNVYELPFCFDGNSSISLSNNRKK
ncbi:hypothetical protein GCM10007285_21670 [Stappia taiwanensis]|uniref:hypothetical protein n=1 Tax=Stappia taiwanensis TaxID=992267 RepID=UPI0019C382C9|nr:hypothetical protein [Stappia taiwanensis]GGE93689.1 hypothetical protein GCM10007285_21670 [Stappia taiwanensis]